MPMFNNKNKNQRPPSPNQARPQNPQQPPPQAPTPPQAEQTAQNQIKTSSYTPVDSHEIEYIIHGNDMQFVEIILDPHETVVSEAGSMMFMDGGVKMETKVGDGSRQNSGVFGSVLGAAKRKITGEQLFMTHYTNHGQGKRSVAFAAPYPGQIIPIELAMCGGAIYCQRGGFLCGAKGTSLGVGLTRRLGAGMFGGDGYILQKLSGDGLAFIHSGGAVVEKTLAPNQVIYVDTGSVVGFESSIDFDIKMVKGLSNMMFGGEALFFSTLKGPGKVWIQSMPFNRLALTMRHTMMMLEQ